MVVAERDRVSKNLDKLWRWRVCARFAYLVTFLPIQISDGHKTSLCGVDELQTSVGQLEKAGLLGSSPPQRKHYCRPYLGRAPNYSSERFPREKFFLHRRIGYQWIIKQWGLERAKRLHRRWHLYLGFQLPGWGETALRWICAWVSTHWLSENRLRLWWCVYVLARCLRYQNQHMDIQTYTTARNNSNARMVCTNGTIHRRAQERDSKICQLKNGLDCHQPT